MLGALVSVVSSVLGLSWDVGAAGGGHQGAFNCCLFFWFDPVSLLGWGFGPVRIPSIQLSLLGMMGNSVGSSPGPSPCAGWTHSVTVLDERGFVPRGWRGPLGAASLLLPATK